MAAGWIYVIVVFALCGLCGWGAIHFLGRASLKTVAVGLALLLASGILPLWLGAYAWPIGTAVAVLGAIVATTQLFISKRRKAGFAFLGVTALIALASPFLVDLSYLEEAERVDRCQGDIAVRAIEATPGAVGHFPVDIHDVGMATEPFQTPSCPDFLPYNSLYRAGSNDYTFGYWTNWIVAKHVCLHQFRQRGWSCGLNRWGPFPPGKEEPLPKQRPA